MPLATAKHDLFQQFAWIGKAMSSPARLELLDLLAQGEKTVETLAQQAGLTLANASNHLRELRMSGLASNRKEGLHVYYRLADPAVHDFLRCLQEIAHRQLAEVREIVREYFQEPESLEPVLMDELLDRSGSWERPLGSAVRLPSRAASPTPARSPAGPATSGSSRTQRISTRAEFSSRPHVTWQCSQQCARSGSSFFSEGSSQHA